MKKLTKPQVLNVLKKLILSALVVTLIVILPMASLKANDDLSMIFGTFLGQKSKYQGIIEIWNIDTFESGTASKASFLTATAKADVL